MLHALYVLNTWWLYLQIFSKSMTSDFNNYDFVYFNAGIISVPIL